MLPYDRLLTLAKLERELALQEDFDALDRLDAERRELLATLPAKPPAAARPLLEEMARVQAETTAALEAARARVRSELGSLERRGDTARGYGRQASPARGTFNAAA